MKRANKVLESWTWEEIDSLLCDFPQPLILKQAFAEWSPVRHWDVALLRQRIGSQQFNLPYSSGCLFPDFSSPSPKTRLLSVDELLDQFRDQAEGGQSPSGLFYLDGIPFFNLGTENAALESLRADIALPPELMPDLLIKSALWIGAANTVSRLHFDGNGCHNLNIQVLGQKEFVLFAPHHLQRVGLMQTPEYKWLSHFSPLDPEPLFEGSLTALGVDYWHCSLEPGDGLVIPAMWFHAVRNRSPINVNVNFWSMPGQVYLSRFLSKLFS